MLEIEKETERNKVKGTEGKKVRLCRNIRSRDTFTIMFSTGELIHGQKTTECPKMCMT